MPALQDTDASAANSCFAMPALQEADFKLNRKLPGQAVSYSNLKFQVCENAQMAPRAFVAQDDLVRGVARLSERFEYNAKRRRAAAPRIRPAPSPI